MHQANMHRGDMAGIEQAPHRAAPGEKQSVGPIVPAMEDCHQGACKVRHLLRSYQPLPLLFFFLLLNFLWPQLLLAAVTFSQLVQRFLRQDLLLLLLLGQALGGLRRFPKLQ